MTSTRYDPAGVLTITAVGLRVGQGRTPVIFFHGYGGDPTAAGVGKITTDHTRAVAAAGHTIYAPRTGTTTFGNPADLTLADAAYTALGRSKVHLMTNSMGTFPGLNWAKRNPTKVASILGWAPLVDLPWAAGQGITGGAYTTAVTPNAQWATDITTAFGSYGATAGYRVFDEPASYRGICPIRFIAASDDTVAPVEAVRAFVAAVNDPAVTMREATGGHLGLFGNVPTAEIVQFFDSNSIAG